MLCDPQLRLLVKGVLLRLVHPYWREVKNDLTFFHQKFAQRFELFCRQWKSNNVSMDQSSRERKKEKGKTESFYRFKHVFPSTARWTGWSARSWSETKRTALFLLSAEWWVLDLWWSHSLSIIPSIRMPEDFYSAPAIGGFSTGLCFTVSVLDHLHSGLGNSRTGSGVMWSMSIIMRTLTTTRSNSVCICCRTLMDRRVSSVNRSMFLSWSHSPEDGVSGPTVYSANWFGKSIEKENTSSTRCVESTHCTASCSLERYEDRDYLSPLVLLFQNTISYRGEEGQAVDDLSSAMKRSANLVVSLTSALPLPLKLSSNDSN